MKQTGHEKDRQDYIDKIKDLEGLTVKSVEYRGKWYDHEEFDLTMVTEDGKKVGTFRIRSSNWYTKE